MASTRHVGDADSLLQQWAEQAREVLGNLDHGGAAAPHIEIQHLAVA